MEHQALDNVMNNKSIIIKPVDKGGGIAVQDTDDCNRESLRLLSDTNTHLVLPHDPLPDFSQEVSLFITRALKEYTITKSKACFLKKEFYKVPYFFHLPKVHKDLTNPPGHPIVAAMESVTSGFSIYVDQFLQPLAQRLPSYIHDGSHLLDTLTMYTWEPTYWWLALDVSSLYTSILHEVGLRASEHFLAEDPLVNPRQANFILEALAFCLKQSF